MLVDAGYRTESYILSQLVPSLSIDEDEEEELLLGSTSDFMPSLYEFCGLSWNGHVPIDEAAAECLLGGWSSGEFVLNEGVRGVKVFTKWTGRYTGRGKHCVLDLPLDLLVG